MSIRSNCEGPKVATTIRNSLPNNVNGMRRLKQSQLKVVDPILDPTLYILFPMLYEEASLEQSNSNV